MFAPQPDGSSVTFWGDAARTAEELRERNPRDADAFVEFDRKVRAIASFLAYVNVATPPDISAPSLADAISGLKLGKAFRGLGAKVRPRGDPRDADGRRRPRPGGLRGRGGRGARCRTRGVLFTAMGPWSAGTAAVFLNDSAGNDGGAAGTAVFARGGTEALADALASAARDRGAEIRTGAEVTEIRRGDRRVRRGDPRGRHRDRRRARRLGRRSEAHAARSCDPVALGPTMLWRAGNIRQPGATAKVNLALSGLPAFHERSRAAARDGS